MRKPQILARRKRNLELGQQDAANRCRFCRRELPTSYLILLTPSGGNLKYCNETCREDDVCASAARGVR